MFGAPWLSDTSLQSLPCLNIKSYFSHICYSVQFNLLSRVRLFATPWIAARQASLSSTNSWSSLRLMSIESVMPLSHLILCCPLLLLPPISPKHQSLFQWVNSSHEVAKVLEFQLQHHSLQRNPKADLLQNGLVGSLCTPRDSQESFPTPQFKRIPGLKNLNTDFKNIAFNSLFTLKEHTSAVNQKIESSLYICWSPYIFPSIFHHRNLYVAYILSVRCTRLF